MKQKTYSSFERKMITLTVMLVAVVEVLDMTIVNVALPDMMGSLSANSEQITWVLTSYIVSSAILMPLTGYLIDRLGQKRLLIVNIVGFLTASILCGMATSLSAMVIFRTAQGVFGASLVPLSQYILRNTYPKKEHGKAMAIWGMGIMAGPVLGPTLGGYITDNLNWRWIFYINTPVCFFALLLAYRFIDKTPRKQISTDWVGMALMASAIACLQIFLDEGNTHDWFSSSLIRFLFVGFISTAAAFFIRGWQTDTNIVRLHLFKDKNFSICTFAITLFSASFLGMIALQPMMLENLMDYPTENTGLLMAPRGIASAIAMGFVANLITRYKAKYLLMIGLGFSFIGSYWMTLFTINTTALTIMLSGAIQGIGMGFFFVPLSTAAFSTLSPSEAGEAAGLFSFGRSIGSSVGISLLTTTMSRQTQKNWHQLGAYIQPYNDNLHTWLNAHHWNLHMPQAIALLTQKVATQASMNAFIDSYVLVTYSFIFILPLLFFLDEGEVGSLPAGVH